MRRDREDDDDAVSVLIGYIINLGIAALVVSLTLFILQGAYTDVRDNAADSEMESIGETFAGEIERVDVLSQRSEKVNTTVDLPDTNTPYTVEVTSTPEGDGQIVLESRRTAVEVGFKNETAIRGAIDGISVPEASSPTIRYDGTEIVIE